MEDFVRKILVVEDEKDLREIIVSLLEENHVHVQCAENGERALEMMQTEKFSLVLSDIQMPVMTGLELLVEAKKLGLAGTFVFLTAFGDQENMLKALRLGAFDFIRKPFDDEEVSAVVDRALEVGYRFLQISRELSLDHSELSEKIKKDERFIRLLGVSNFKKRA